MENFYLFSEMLLNIELSNM